MNLVLFLLIIQAAAAAGSTTSIKTILRGRYVSINILGEDCIVKPDDGNATNTIQKHLDDPKCGKVIVSGPSNHTITALEFTRNNTELHLEEGTILRVSNDRQKWPGQENVVSANHLEHLAITGTGTFDGNGLDWWRNSKEFRPHLVQFNHVNNALLSDTLYLNAPNHVLELYCDNCELSGVKVLSPPSTGQCEKDGTCSHNTDAVDIHGSPFFVHDVNFTTGDDNVAMHANNTLVEDSYFGTGHGASIGSLCNDWLTNITVRNVTFRGTTAGARIKSHPNCSGRVWNVTYENLTMHDVDQAIVLTQFYFGDGPSTYLFEDIRFQNILVTSSSSSSLFKSKDCNNGKGNKDDCNMIQFDCDNHYDGKGNCRVILDNVKFDGFVSTNGDGFSTKMTCKGTIGTAKNLDGINNCLHSQGRRNGI